MNIQKFPALVLLLLPACVFAQTAAEMDLLLQSETVSAAKSARFVMGAADLLPAELHGAAAEMAAYEMALSKGWIRAAAEEDFTMKDTAFLVMKAFDLKGGIMYSLFRNPRYAYREMIYRNLITDPMNGTMKVSGSALLVILDKTIHCADEAAAGRELR